MNAEMLIGTFTTNMDIVKEIIPRSLVPAKKALDEQP
jgi:hypothetical protein